MPRLVVRGWGGPPVSTPTPTPPPAPTPAWTVADPDFLAGLVDVVRIEFDANAGGTTRTSGGGYQPGYQLVEGMAAVPCRLTGKSAMNIVIGGSLAVIARARVLFAQPVDLDRRNRLVYVDPDTGRTEHWFVQGRSRSRNHESGADQVTHHYVVDVYDRFI